MWASVRFTHHCNNSYLYMQQQKHFSELKDFQENVVVQMQRKTSAAYQKSGYICIVFTLLIIVMCVVVGLLRLFNILPSRIILRRPMYKSTIAFLSVYGTKDFIMHFAAHFTLHSHFSYSLQDFCQIHKDSKDT